MSLAEPEEPQIRIRVSDIWPIMASLIVILSVFGIILQVVGVWLATFFMCLSLSGSNSSSVKRLFLVLTSLLLLAAIYLTFY
jgi:hypothetical protein